MRTLHACLWLTLRDRASTHYWIRFLGLSFWLILGLNTLSSPTAAKTLDYQSKDSQSPITAIAPQASSLLTKEVAPQATEVISQRPPETVITLLTERDASIASSFATEQPQETGISVVSTRKSPSIKNSSPTAALGFAETLGLRGNQRSLPATAIDELMLISLEEPAIAIAKMPVSRPNETAITEASLSLIEAPESVLTQLTEPTETTTETSVAQPDSPSEPIERYRPLLEFQAVSIYQDDDFSGRLRATGIYALNEQVLFGAVVDLTTGNAFVDSEAGGLSLNELYVSAAPIRNTPNLRLVGGLIDLTSYFDRNSFAKDAATHFFNPVFQTNPALSAAGITSRPGLLVNWSATDNLELKAAAFSSTRDLGDFAIDGFAAEVGFRVENFILRGTYATARDAGEDDGFAEIFQFQRDDGGFGLSDDDREVAYGLNAEYFFESINLGIFGRYGWYENQDLDEEGTTFSLGVTALDVFLEGDRLGLAYGQRLSNSDLRSGKTPDVWEVLYDAPIFDGVRAGISLQSQDEFSDTFLGLRLRADW